MLLSLEFLELVPHSANRQQPLSPGAMDTFPSSRRGRNTSNYTTVTEVGEVEYVGIL